jgi:hypothetical protein
MAPRRDSVRARRICFDTHRQQDKMGVFLRCALCLRRIDPVRRSRDWRADHYPTRFADGGEDTPENLRPICIWCDSGTDGKAAQDTREVAKRKRISGRHFGLKPKRPWKPEGYKYDWSQRRYVKETERE